MTHLIKSMSANDRIADPLLLRISFNGSAFFITYNQILATPDFLAASAVASATASFTLGSNAFGRM